MQSTFSVSLAFLQYLSMMVQSGNLKGQARAFSTLARLYEETKQLTKAHDHYRKVGCASHFDSLSLLLLALFPGAPIFRVPGNEAILLHTIMTY